MRKYIFPRILSVIFAVTLIASISLNTFAVEFDNKIADNILEIAESLRVNTVLPENEKSIVSFCAVYNDQDEAEINIIVDNTFLQKCQELNISIFVEGKRNPIYHGMANIDNVAPAVTGLTIGTKYDVLAQGTHGVSVDSFIGYLILREKKGELSVEYKLTHETYSDYEYNKPYVSELRVASERLQPAHDKFGCNSKDNSHINDNAALIDELDTQNSAATLLSEYAIASVRYEVESNNTIALADRIYDDDTTYGTIGYSGDVDFFKVLFTSAGNANFWLGDIPSGEDYDFYLYDANGNLLKSSTTTANQEQIYNFPVIANTWYYMKVIGYNGSYNTNDYYRIRAKNYPNIVNEDVYEVNDSRSSATYLSTNSVLTDATIHEASDVDYFRFSIPATQNINITLSNIPSNCDYDLQVLNSSNVIDSSEKGGNETETIQCSLSAGTYWIRVNSYSGYSNVPYRLHLTASTPSYVLSIASYVDQGYMQRFSNAISAVRGHQEVIGDILDQLYNINLSYSTALYTSYADDCKIQMDGSVTESNLIGDCDHTNTHLTTNALRNELISDKGTGSSTLSRVLWTGHVLPGNPASNSSSSSNTVVITPMAVVDSMTYENRAAEVVQRESRYTLLHEVSHQLSAHDHYCYGVEPGQAVCGNPYCCRCNGIEAPSQCIMTVRTNIETVALDDLYCSVCKVNIQSHLSEHH